MLLGEKNLVSHICPLYILYTTASRLDWGKYCLCGPYKEKFNSTYLN